MPPQQVNPQSPIQDQELATPMPFWQRKIVWIPFAILVLVGGGVYMFASQQPLSPQTGETARTSETAAEWKFPYMARNLELVLSNGWETISASEISLPKGLAGTLFAFQKNGTSCTLAYIRTPAASLKNYPEGERAFMVNNTNVDNQYIGFWSGNVLISYYPHRYSGGSGDWPFGNDADEQYLNAFVLFPSQVGAVVDESCVKDMENIMTQFRNRYDSVSLTAQSEGVLYIVSEEVEGAEIDQVRFVPNGATTAHSVMSLTATSRPTPQFAGGKLYVVIEGELRTLDPFTKTNSKVLDIDLPEGQRIEAFLVENSKIIYLAGVDCLSYMAKCDLDLYEYDSVSKRSTKLADHLPYHELIGYDSSAKEILMTYRFADGGERSENTGIYQYGTDEIRKIASFEQEQGRFSKPVATYDYIRVSGGKLVAPGTPVPARESRWFISYR